MILKQFDICVVGGGPAGCIAAMRFARLGYSVFLIHKTRQQSSTIESLSPGAVQLLTHLGFDLERLTTATVSVRTLVRWTTTTFEENSPATGLHVHRDSFDATLQAAAAEVGVVVQEGRASDLRWHQGGEEWGFFLNKDCEVRSSFLVDASGRRNILGGSKKRWGQPTLAVSTRWRVAECETAESFVEAGESCWYWGLRLPGGLLRIVAFIDPRSGAGASRSKSHATEFYNAITERCLYLTDRLKSKKLCATSVCDATILGDPHPISRNYIKLGDASMTLDPLSSQGVQEAISSSLRGAVIVNTLLRRSSSARLAMQFYHSRQIESLRDHLRVAAQFYRSAFERRTDFWKRRAGDEDVPTVASRVVPLSENDYISLSADTRIVETPAAKGDFVVKDLALEHPALAGPLAFVNGVPMAALAQTLGGGAIVRSLMQTRSSHEQDRVFGALNWLASRGIVVSRRKSAVSAPAEGFRNGRGNV